MRIIFIGDIVGKGARETLIKKFLILNLDMIQMLLLLMLKTQLQGMV